MDAGAFVLKLRGKWRKWSWAGHKMLGFWFRLSPLGPYF